MSAQGLLPADAQRRRRGFWLEQALSAEADGAGPRLLQADVRADVCIIGGGFTGLWTALELRNRRPDLGIVLVEADVCGGGASGRNSGFLSPSWHAIDDLALCYGEDPAVRYATAVADGIAAAAEFCRRHHIDAHLHTDGIVYLSTTTEQRSRDLVAHAERHGVGRRLVYHDRETLQRLARSPRFVAGAYSADGGTVQPALLARGLRRVAVEQGVEVFERTGATKIDHGRPHLVVCADGHTVKAPSVVLATGAWSGNWRPLRNTFVNLLEGVAVTEPIPRELSAIGWTGQIGFVGGPDLLYALRKTEDGRVSIAGGLVAATPGARTSRTPRAAARLTERAAAGLAWLFPELEGVRFTHAWTGPMDVTVTEAPFYCSYASGSIHAGLGYSGHGLAASVVGGKILASLTLRDNDRWTALPVVGQVPMSYPPEPVRWPLAAAVIRATAYNDRRRMGGRDESTVARLVATSPRVYRKLLARVGATAATTRRDGADRRGGG